MRSHLLARSFHEEPREWFDKLLLERLLPGTLVSIDWGTPWARSRASLVAEVPSIMVPEESNILINPTYLGAARLQVSKLRKWSYDLRLYG